MAEIVITQSMLDALRGVSRNDGRQAPSGAHFRTMEGLVTRGLVERSSCKVVEMRYSSKWSFNRLQVKDPKGWWIHEYWITDLGRTVIDLGLRAGAVDLTLLKRSVA